MRAAAARCARGVGPALLRRGARRRRRARPLSSCVAEEACAPEYASSAAALADAAGDVDADVLYVVGGLYGNGLALAALEAALRDEARAVAAAGGALAVCFNGDFNFFNATPEAWRDVNARVRAFGATAGCASVATFGNVEVEVARDIETRAAAAGCGCAYPAYVGADFAGRAAAIVNDLRSAARRADDAAAVAWLRSLSAHATFRVGGARVAALHGDPTCVNGWRLAAEHVRDPRGPPFNRAPPGAPATDLEEVAGWFDAAACDVFAASHTCLPFLQEFAPGKLLANNGAGGMANFAGDARGLATRVAAAGAPPSRLAAPLYGAALPGGATVDAVPVPFDVGAYLAAFDATWPRGSPAAVSYRDRLAGGVADWTPDDADRCRRA